MKACLLPVLLASLSAAAIAAAPAAESGKTCTCACPSAGSASGAGCGGDTAGATAPAASSDAIKRHPLKGVIVAVRPEQSALTVKHEEIPGVMRAMTMQFKVDAATLKQAQKGQAITGLMSRQNNEWVLEDVKFVAAPKR
jgi:Cu/Ag efflux protein CusF